MNIDQEIEDGIQRACQHQKDSWRDWTTLMRIGVGVVIHISPDVSILLCASISRLWNLDGHVISFQGNHVIQMPQRQAGIPRPVQQPYSRLGGTE